MATLRAAVIIYSDVELIGHLLGLTVTGFIDLMSARRAGNPYPPLYESGIKYQREPPGSEVWMIPRGMKAARVGDCEDLCCARVAELWADGETAARPYVKRINARLRHILVQRWDESLEDASLILGMHDKSDPHEKVVARSAVKPLQQTPNSRLLPELERLIR